MTITIEYKQWDLVVDREATKRAYDNSEKGSAEICDCSESYREWARSGEKFELGEVQFVQVEPTIWIANMIGQRDVKRGKDGTPPVRYDAIRKSLTKVSAFAIEINASVHMPRIGCGLAGGTWDQIEPSLIHALTGMGIETVVYDFE